MSELPIVVLGAGVAGLASTLTLARSGHRVILVERDELGVGRSQDAPEWRRKGIPHFLQPHAFIPRGRLELRWQLPDVYGSLLQSGARDVDLRVKLPGPAAPEDEVLQYLAVRRPLLEWALRRAVAAEQGVEVREQVRVEGLRIEGGRVGGVRVAGTEIEGRLVVDALGRRTPTSDWLAAASPPAQESDCGVVYYSRYYRQRPGFDLPDGPWLLSPRGDLGYMGYASFPGDNRTFAAVLATPPGIPEWRAFRRVEAFEAAVGAIPALRSWVNPEGVDPITEVLSMAGLRNSLRLPVCDAVKGFVRIGDAFTHTDPVLAHGLAFALVHARELTRALAAHADVDDALADFSVAVTPAVRERYELATALDAQRLRLWTGGQVDFARHDGDYALFSMVAAGAVAMRDPEIFRVFVRRIGLLDGTAVLDENQGLQRRIEAQFREILSSPRPPGGPSREEMLALLQR